MKGYAILWYAIVVICILFSVFISPLTNISENKTFQIYFALNMIMIPTIPQTNSKNQFFNSSGLLFVNILYPQRIVTIIPAKTMIGTIIFEIILKIKFFIVSHHHRFDFGSEASR